MSVCLTHHQLSVCQIVCLPFYLSGCFQAELRGAEGRGGKAEHSRPTRQTDRGPHTAHRRQALRPIPTPPSSPVHTHTNAAPRKCVNTFDSSSQPDSCIVSALHVGR